MISISFTKFACFTATLFIFNLDVNCSVRRSSDVPSWGLPSKHDGSAHLASVERLMRFCDSHKNDIDLNLYFGLFLLNVNLRHVLLKKSAVIPQSLKATLKRIVGTNGRLVRFFQNMAAKTQNPENPTSKNISFLFRNVDSWARRINGYDSVLHIGMKRRTTEELFQKFSSWSAYKERINSYSTFVPAPEQSDKCLVSLAQNPSKHQGSPYKCLILGECYHAIENGTSYGYAITHRLLILLAARYSRGCFIYSPQVDDAVAATLCNSMYDEAQYIAVQGYRHPDLLMEQMGLCSLAGYKEFLQRSWLAEVLKRQRTYGCFGLDLTPGFEVAVTDAPRPWTLAKEGTQMIMGRQCNEHLSAVAAGILGAAVRYIIETYY